MTTVVPSTAPSPAASVTPRTWSFIDRYTGKPVSYTCMLGCTLNHTSEIESPTFPEDVWCWTWPQAMTLPVNENGEPEEFRVLSAVIKVEPWSQKIAERIPFAIIELVDDHFIDGLDPDGLATVIRTLSDRLEQMRDTHRRLVEVRGEYMSRHAPAA